MTQDEYDAIKASSPAQSFKGAVRAYWVQRPCGCGGCGGSAYEKAKALRLDGGGMLRDFDPLLWVGGSSGASLPEGTRVSIDVPAGAMPPFNYFCGEPMKFQAAPDDGVLWCDEHERPSAEAPEEIRCDEENPCCRRAGEYNGFGSDGPLAFNCPKDCPCHD